MSRSFISIRELETHFPLSEGLFFKRRKGTVKAVDGVSLEVEKGEILGLVGESGCGKSTLARTVMRLTEKTNGSVVLDGRDLHELSGKELKKARPEFQMIFQDPLASLNPRMTVFDMLSEPLVFHGLAKKSERAETVSRLMEEVGLSPRQMKKYPHEFSGGQCQRLAIARALALQPKLIVADEPVSALDVSIQSQILNLLVQLTKKRALTMIFISHDLSVVKHIADRTAVMYLGKIMEIGRTDRVFERPRHPYTQVLISAIPLPDPKVEKARKRILLKGDPPSAIDPPPGCRFHPRCPAAKERCSRIVPELKQHGEGHQAACLYDDISLFENT
ncbi:MAG: ATP-binding cassette domain-containing protein [Proteobacteria bacterium]|nr:ATP-binding cassette domain-containing protein [Pseudomonadota bacterium]